MKAFVLFLYTAWLIRTAHHTLVYTSFWQLKEYRLDRMMDLWSTPKGRSYYFNVFTFLQLLGLVMLWVGYVREEFLGFAANGLAVIFLAEALIACTDIFYKRLKRPKLTIKAIIILSVTFILDVWFVYFFLDGNIINPDTFQLVLLLTVFALFLADINALVVFLFYPATLFAKRAIYKRARKKLAAFNNLKIIGITGSYGKSTTKEFLKVILSQKFCVYATEGNTNTEIGVANAVLDKLENKHQIFIAEMGAYKKGEIKTICDFLEPHIGIITGINEQHVGLFGSVAQTMRAKSELIKCLPQKGYAVLNADNEYCISLRSDTDAQVITYGILSDADIIASDIIVQPESVSFTVYLDGRKHFMQAPIIGRKNVLNILACVAVAYKLGMNWEEITRGVAKLVMPYKTLNVTTHGDTVLIDDTYNTNPDGLRAALEYMTEAYTDYKKIVVFPGILELGTDCERVHETLGVDIAHDADYFFISSVDFSEYLVRGARLGGMDGDHVKVIDSVDAMMKELNHIVGKKIILFESRGMERVLHRLK